MDMEGRVALTKEVDMSTIGSIGTSQIGLSEIPAGVYHLFIKGNSLYFTSKLVVVH
jgi:hypothetical protein